MMKADPVPLKPGDSRSRRFVKQHGRAAYELDAFHPEQLQKLVRESIEAFTDMSEYDENSAKEGVDHGTIAEMKDLISDYTEELIIEMGI